MFLGVAERSREKACQRSGACEKEAEARPRTSIASTLGIATGYSEQFRRVLFDLYVR